MSKQSNLGSAPPSPIDIDTPDGSIFGADLRDNETQYTYQWNEQQQQLINAHRNYHSFFCRYCQCHKLHKKQCVRLTMLSYIFVNDRVVKIHFLVHSFDVDIHEGL